MTLAALALLLVLCWLPFGAALGELFSDPGAMLATATSSRVLGLLGGKAERHIRPLPLRGSSKETIV